MSEPSPALAVPRTAGPVPEPPPTVDALRRERRIVALGGGKGGIGKSVLAANVAAELARRGRQVLLVDGDLGGANLHTYVGLDQPRRSLSDFVEGRVARLTDVVVPTSVPNLSLVSGALDGLGATTPAPGQRMRLLGALGLLAYDVVVLDLGAGTHPTTIDFYLLADDKVFVLVPEPAAAENAWRFVKAAFWRRVRNVASVYGFELELRRALGSGPAASPVEVLARLQAIDADAAVSLSSELRAFRPRLVVNQVRAWQDAVVGPEVVASWRRFLGVDIDYLGHVEHDEELWRAARLGRPLFLVRPDAPAAACVVRVVDALENSWSRPAEGGSS